MENACIIHLVNIKLLTHIKIQMDLQTEQWFDSLCMYLSKLHMSLFYIY